jgi:hypothetical protein
MFRCHPLGAQKHPLRIYLSVKYRLQGDEVRCKSGHCRTNKFLSFSVYSHGAMNICVIVSVCGGVLLYPQPLVSKQFYQFLSALNPCNAQHKRSRIWKGA